ncbi:MAG TPA: PAS domain-containing sensor histidine kinase [Spirillospora sp.]|nr:PAS domain-containing sensor histidine kinase [Spirillospora sp.]
MPYSLPDDLAAALKTKAQAEGSSVEDLIRMWLNADDDQDVLRRLHKSETRYQAIVQSQIDLICRYTPDTVLTFVNDAYCKFFQKSRDELLGRSFLILNPQEQHERIHRRITAVLRNPGPEIAIYNVVMPDGDIRWIQWVDHGVVDEHGQVVEIQAVGHDITELKRLEEQRVRTAALEAELTAEREANELKNRFISTISHEFRNPLSVIKASADMLLHYGERMSKAKVEEHLARIIGQVDLATGLLDDVLALDATRAGTLDFHPEPADIAGFCQSLVEYFRRTDDKQHDIVFEGVLPPGQIAADLRFLNRILTNLMSNAIKYSPAGSRIRLAAAVEAGDLVLQVEDEGIGIPKDEQIRIFDSFFRARNAQHVVGTGLGLTIVRQHVEAYGGRISVTSQPGQGAVFRVWLPLRDCDK